MGFVVELNIWKHEVAPFVPAALREFRFGTYVTGQTAWDDTPLYIWDEWNAYIRMERVHQRWRSRDLALR